MSSIARDGSAKTRDQAKRTTGQGKLSPVAIEKLAKRWLNGEPLAKLGGEAGLSWQSLAGILNAAGYQAKNKKQIQPEKNTTDWLAAAEKAARTNKWSITMLRWLVSRLKTRTKWRLVTFTGPNGGESVGVVDILAVRKDHHTDRNGLKQGDLLEMILIQVKGGKAPRPSAKDIDRLRKVGSRFGARGVLLAEWIKGSLPMLSYLKRTGNDPDRAWKPIADPLDVFW